MKSRIPSDVDRLMWLVAESQELGAYQDFERRFPEFSAELARRRRMVTELKGARAPHAVEPAIPAFRPRQEIAPPPSRAIWVVGSVALAAIAVASYSVTKLYTTPNPKPVLSAHVNTEPINSGGGVVYSPPKSPEVVPQNPPAVQQQPPPDLPRGEVPKSLKLSDTSLIAALKMIGGNAGYNVDVAPGFEDQTVSIDYRDVTTTEMLRDLGQRYNFTAFDQGDGTIIIVPAVDKGADEDADLNRSQRRIGG